MMKTDLLHITIDGPAGAGKSTVAREVARRLGILYLDTGAMYRAVTWKALQNNTDLADAEAVTHLARETSLAFLADRQRVICDDIDVTEAIRKPEVSASVSAVATVPGVRACLTDLQRRQAQMHSIVLDGRDIGSSVLPQALVKIFLTADLQQRALRRQKDLRAQDLEVDLESVAKDIAIRDDKDSHRATAPLKQAADAVLIDTSQMTFDEVVEKILDLVRRAIQ